MPPCSVFQSTLPVRGATPFVYERLPFRAYFNPRSPCGERLTCCRTCMTFFLFQSTLPVRGATDPTFPASFRFSISIHAPRAGSDVLLLLLFIIARISIHAPRAGSDGLCGNSFDYDRRISIHAPRAGSDVFSLLSASRFRISIHAPRAGSDFSERITAPSPSVFQSTLPVRGATYALGLAAHAGVFQSTLPVRGATISLT